MLALSLDTESFIHLTAAECSYMETLYCRMCIEATHVYREPEVTFHMNVTVQKYKFMYHLLFPAKRSRSRCG